MKLRYNPNTASNNTTYRYQKQDTTGSVTTTSTSGIYCSICGSKMYRDKNMQLRCPSCDDSWTFPMNIIADEV